MDGGGAYMYEVVGWEGGTGGGGCLPIGEEAPPIGGLPPLTMLKGRGCDYTHLSKIVEILTSGVWPSRTMMDIDDVS